MVAFGPEAIMYIAMGMATAIAIGFGLVVAFIGICWVAAAVAAHAAYVAGALGLVVLALCCHNPEHVPGSEENEALRLRQAQRSQARQRHFERRHQDNAAQARAYHDASNGVARRTPKEEREAQQQHEVGPRRVALDAPAAKVKETRERIKFLLEENKTIQRRWTKLSEGEETKESLKEIKDLLKNFDSNNKTVTRLQTDISGQDTQSTESEPDVLMRTESEPETSATAARIERVADIEAARIKRQQGRERVRAEQKALRDTLAASNKRLEDSKKRSDELHDQLEELRRNQTGSDAPQSDAPKRGKVNVGDAGATPTTVREIEGR
jgi:hypothetical protein